MLNTSKTLFLLALMAPFSIQGQTITVEELTRKPVLNEERNDWSSLSTSSVKVHPITPVSVVEATEVQIVAGRFGETVCFYLEWVDSEPDKLHKPYIWDQQREKYVRGPQREDRLALQFEMEGRYDSDWRVGNSFKADMWHWKSSRSNPLGLAHDKVTTVSTDRLLRAAKIDGHERPVYVLRENDQGTPLYSTKRYAKKIEPIMPKYQLNTESSGSITDIRAKGIWKKQRWHLELCREMDTGHVDDVRFIPGNIVRGAIAVFDASENEDHKISRTLEFQF